MPQFQRPISLSSRLPEPRLRLALGLTCHGVNTVSVDAHTGTLAYPASGVVVLFDMVKNRQIQYINQARKCVKFVCFSPDGKLLLVGESGSGASLYVWGVRQAKALATFRDHCYGMACAAVTSTNDLIVTVGTKHDSTIVVRAWPSQTKISSSRFSETVNSISVSPVSTEFVTCGHRHIKFWQPSHGVPGRKGEHTEPLVGRPATLGGLKTHFFQAVAWGAGRSLGHVFAVTRAGVVCKISSDSRTVKKSRYLRTTKMTSVQAHNDLLIVGTQCGYVTFLNVDTLKIITSLTSPMDICYAEQALQARRASSKSVNQQSEDGNPVDRSLAEELTQQSAEDHDVGQTEGGAAGKSIDSLLAEQKSRVFLALDTKHELLAVALSNGSLCVWDISDPEDMRKTHYSVSHSKAISSLDVMTSHDKEDRETLVTVAHDSTVRLWQMSTSRNVCCESSRAIYTDLAPSDVTAGSDVILTDCGVEEAKEAASAPSEEVSLITTSKVSPDNCVIVTGDAHGRLSLYDAHSLVHLEVIHRHTRAVTSLCFSSSRLADTQPLRLLLSGGKDREIHTYSYTSSHSFSLLSRLTLHSSSVTSLALCPLPAVTSQGEAKLMLFSASLDRSVVISTSPLCASPRFKPHNCQHSSSVVVDMLVHRATPTDVQATPTDVQAMPRDVHATPRDVSRDVSLLVGRSNGEVATLDVWGMNVKHKLQATTSKDARLEKMFLDSGSSLLLCACSDHTTNVLSYPGGVLLCSVASHTKTVSGLRFSGNMRYMISTAEDGCVFMWRMPPKVLKAGRVLKMFYNRSKKVVCGSKVSHDVLVEMECQKESPEDNEEEVRCSEACSTKEELGIGACGAPVSAHEKESSHGEAPVQKNASYTVEGKSICTLTNGHTKDTPGGKGRLQPSSMDANAVTNTDDYIDVYERHPPPVHLNLHVDTKDLNPPTEHVSSNGNDDFDFVSSCGGIEASESQDSQVQSSLRIDAPSWHSLSDAGRHQAASLTEENIARFNTAIRTARCCPIRAMTDDEANNTVSDVSDLSLYNTEGLERGLPMQHANYWAAHVPTDMPGVSPADLHPLCVPSNDNHSQQVYLHPNDNTYLLHNDTAYMHQNNTLYIPTCVPQADTQRHVQSAIVQHYLASNINQQSSSSQSTKESQRAKQNVEYQPEGNHMVHKDSMENVDVPSEGNCDVQGTYLCEDNVEKTPANTNVLGDLLNNGYRFARDNGFEVFGTKEHEATTGMHHTNNTLDIECQDSNRMQRNSTDSNNFYQSDGECFPEYCKSSGEYQEHEECMSAQECPDNGETVNGYQVQRGVSGKLEFNEMTVNECQCKDDASDNESHNSTIKDDASDNVDNMLDEECEVKVDESNKECPLKGDMPDSKCKVEDDNRRLSEKDSKSKDTECDSVEIVEKVCQFVDITPKNECQDKSSESNSELQNRCSISDDEYQDKGSMGDTQHLAKICHTPNIESQDEVHQCATDSASEYQCIHSTTEGQEKKDNLDIPDRECVECACSNENGNNQPNYDKNLPFLYTQKIKDEKQSQFSENTSEDVKDGIIDAIDS